MQCIQHAVNFTSASYFEKKLLGKEHGSPTCFGIFLTVNVYLPIQNNSRYVSCSLSTEAISSDISNLSQLYEHLHFQLYDQGHATTKEVELGQTKYETYNLLTPYVYDCTTQAVIGVWSCNFPDRIIECLTNDCNSNINYGNTS